jgi:hypothetical protein
MASLDPSRRAPGLAAFAAFAAALFLGAALALAADYEFFLSNDLKASLPKQVGKAVKVVDRLVKIWEYQKEGESIRFDTEKFRCAIPASETESIAYLREVMKGQEGVDKTPSTTPPLVCIYGTVTRSELWGKPKEGKEAGKEEDEIVIMTDKVEKPRQRFFDEGY